MQTRSGWRRYDKLAHWAGLSGTERMKKSAHWLLTPPPSPQAQRPLCAPCRPRNWCKFPATQAGPARANPPKITPTDPSPAAYPGGGPRASNLPHQRSLPQHQQHPLWWRRPRFPRPRPPPSSPPPLPSGPAASEPAPAPGAATPAGKILATSRSDTLQACPALPESGSSIPSPAPQSSKLQTPQYHAADGVLAV